MSVQWEPIILLSINQAAGESGMMSQWNTNALGDAQFMFALMLKHTRCADVRCMVDKSAEDISRWVKVFMAVRFTWRLVDWFVGLLIDRLGG